MSEKKVTKKAVHKIVLAALEIEGESARDAGAMGFTARAMVLATMPHTKPKGNEFQRINGDYRLTMMAPSEVGLPYGVIPRLLLAWISTEVVRTKSRDLVLGDSLTAFMRELDMVPTGGRWGSIGRLKDQVKRLFSCSISATYDGEDSYQSIAPHNIVSKAELWWEAPNPEQGTLWQSQIRVSEQFFEEIMARPIPIDLRALKALKKSPMALDVYIWLTYRMSSVNSPVAISWATLQKQFGANYSRKIDFKVAFQRALAKVQTVYPEADVTPGPKGLAMNKSPTHIPRKAHE